MTPQERQAQIMANILGSYNNVPTIVKSEETKELGTEEEKKEESTEAE